MLHLLWHIVHELPVGVGLLSHGVRVHEGLGTRWWGDWGIGCCRGTVGHGQRQGGPGRNEHAKNYRLSASCNPLRNRCTTSYTTRTDTSFTLRRHRVLRCTHERGETPNQAHTWSNWEVFMRWTVAAWSSSRSPQNPAMMSVDTDTPGIMVRMRCRRESYAVDSHEHEHEEGSVPRDPRQERVHAHKNVS